MPTRSPPNYSSIDIETALERIRQLEESAGLGFAVHPRYGLTKTEEMLLGLIVACPAVLTKDHAYTVLYGMHENPPLEKILDVYISKLRKKLRALNIQIETAWGRGWYIEPAERAKALALRVEEVAA
jgi:DNA-binding response OmpR family regulator